MPAPRGFTATSAAIKDAADRALDAPEGLTLTWRNSDHGPDGSKFKSRSFQCAFNALRSRARRMKAAHTGRSVDALDMDTQGPYDRLACVRSPLPGGDGWYVGLLPAQMLYDEYQITDNATGEPLKGESPTDKRYGRLINDMQHHPERVTPEEWAWGCAHVSDHAEFNEAWFKPRRPDLYAQGAADADTLPEKDYSLAPVPVKPEWMK